MSDTYNPFSLRSKIAVVTGCSSGLGKAMAIGLAQAGAKIVGINIEEPIETEKDIKGIGGSFSNVLASVTDFDRIPEIIEECNAVYGRTDILVNNAGIIRRNEIFDFSHSDWDDVMDINIKSVFFMSQAFAKHNAESEIGGKIINIASMLSFQGGIRIPSYTASKSGVMGLTRLLANELGRYGMNVNAIAPGYFVTKATEAIRKDEVRNKEILDRIPSGRWGEPKDLSGTAVFLASSASDYINGYTIAVDGGWLSR